MSGNYSGQSYSRHCEPPLISSSDRPEDYTKGEPIGFGASSIVYSALYRPINEDGSTDVPNGLPCALKVLDLDSLPPNSLRLLQRETNLMSLSKHPNVLRVRGSWMAGHKLCIALRLMNKGSAADVMRYGWSGGMEEEVVRCILRQALKGLKYVACNYKNLNFFFFDKNLLFQLSPHERLYSPRYKSCQSSH
jgi:serine/threonine-protein kinase OSR1/STK39